MIQLQNLETELPKPLPTSEWKHEVDGILVRYEAAPALSYGDERLRPIFGGITTLTYYGEDLGQKLLDQRIPPGSRLLGSSIGEACEGGAGAAMPAASDPLSRSLENPSRPAFQFVWVPTPLAGRLLADDARCDDRGTPLGNNPQDHFCMFARLAMQPGVGHPLTMVVHGMFDSSAQDYVQRMGAILYAQGHSVLLPDMRDHGDTFRANPQVPTSLGTLEGGDLRHLARVMRTSCGSRVSTIGGVGVSGGGLAMIRAQSMDIAGEFDGGVIAISPLIDVDATLDNLSVGNTCPEAEAIEITWQEYGALTGVFALAAGGGAALAQGLSADPVDEKTAIAAGVGALAGLTIAAIGDAIFDGDSALSNNCVARSSVASLFLEMLQERWRTLQAQPQVAALSEDAQRVAPAKVTLNEYLKLRSEPFYAQLGKSMRHYNASWLAYELRALPQGPGRLLVLGAADDPVTLEPALVELQGLVHHLKNVHVRAVEHGGHGAMWVVQQSLMERLFDRFFVKPPPQAPPTKRIQGDLATPAAPSSPATPNASTLQRLEVRNLTADDT